jgi:hypothetical protein
MKENNRQIWASNLTTAQTLEGIKFMAAPRIACQMTCADLSDRDLREFDQWLRGTIMNWLRVTEDEVYEN